MEATLLVIRKGRRVLLSQRPATARRMAGFWDLPLPEEIPEAVRTERLGSFRHTITHHHYTFEVWAAEVKTLPPGAFRWFAPGQFAGIPLATTARKGLTLAGIL